MLVSLDDFKAVLRVLKEKDIALKVKTHSGWSSDYLHIIGFIAAHAEQSSKTFGGVVLQHDIDGYRSSVVYHLTDNRSLKALIID
jgi:hypothetical protein